MSCMTKFPKKLSLTLSAIMLTSFVAGCASSRFENTAPPVVQHQNQDRAAPLNQVSQSDLPPVEGGENQQGTADHLASVNEPMAAMDLMPSHVSGVWRVNVDDTTCQVATPQTKTSKGFRANALHCPADFAQAGAWNVNGKQLKFFNKSGDDLAVLYSTDGSYFSGLTSSGKQITLSR